MAKALRFEGNFFKALNSFQRLLYESVKQDFFYEIQCRILFSLADLYCELCDAKAALQVLRPRMKHDVKPSDDCNAKLLTTSFAEALIQECQLGETESYLLQAISFYDRTSDLNNISRMTHVRACFALAKVSTIKGQWYEALSR